MNLGVLALCLYVLIHSAGLLILCYIPRGSKLGRNWIVCVFFMSRL